MRLNTENFNPFQLASPIMFAVGLYFMPGIWWAKLLVFLGLMVSVSITWK